MQERLERAVDILRGSKQPEPARFVPVLVVHSRTPLALNLDEAEAQVVARVVGVPNGKFLDVPGTPPFDLLVAEASDLAIDTACRYLSARRPPVFAVLGRAISDLQLGIITEKAGRLAYDLILEKLTDGTEIAVGTASGVAPGWIALELLEETIASLEFDTTWAVAEVVRLAKEATR